MSEEDFTPPYRFPFLIGQYMATNAIPDAYSIVDGPDCLFFKTEYIHGKHDLRSTLLDVFGNHRIALTNVNAGNVALSRGEAVRAKIRKIDGLPGSSVIFVTSLPMVTIIGTQYDNLIRDIQPEVAAQVIEVPGRSLQGDWLMGYTDTLNALAAAIDVSDARPDPKKVALVGYLCDRNEEDHNANVRELERMFAAVGLELVCVWLGNQPYSKLCEARHAGTLISLPLGRKAAGLLAQRTGAAVIEAEVPFGLGRTQRLLRKAAKAAGTLPAAEAFIDAELRRLLPRVEWLIPHLFLGKKVMFSGEPDLFGGFLQTAGELGMEVLHLSAPCAPEWQTEDLAREFGGLPPIFFEPKVRQITAEMERLQERGLDLAVCNSEMRRFGLDLNGAAVVELGFPSKSFHAVYERPFLGFAGWTCFVDRMANVLSDSPGRDKQRAMLEMLRTHLPPELVPSKARLG